MTVDDGGNLLVMQSGKTGLSVVRYAFRSRKSRVPLSVEGR